MEKEAQGNTFQLYLLIFNISKHKNAGTLIRSAAAFNCKEVFLLENKKKSKHKVFFGSHGTEEQTNYRIFRDLDHVKSYCLKNAIRICGVEIMPQSVPVHKQPFKCSTLIMMGNEGTGLNENQKAICDDFVYIPQYTYKTSCLNVAVAGSIVMQHFASWAGYKEIGQIGEKFDTSEKKTGYIVFEGEEEEAKKEKKLVADKSSVPIGNLFGDD